ncbi:major capsid protein [Caudoviricetes sp.]|nr:major capsid protein [Caudoviricetes sp.]
MTIQTYGLSSQRVGKLKGEILAHAVPVEVLGITGMTRQHPKNVGNNVIFRRWLPYGGTDNRWITGSNVNTFASAHITTEGVTPSADALSPTDVTVTLQEYACLYALTNVTEDLYEDNIPDEMKKQTGERIGLIREMVTYGAVKSITNVFYGGSGSSKATVNGTVTLNMIRKIAKSLKANHAKQITSILSASANFATSPVEASYLVFCSTDMEPAIRDLPGFKVVAEYGQRKPIHENEIGSCENFRFVTSPELAADINGGAAVGSTGLYSTGGSNIDIYPMIVTGADSWGTVALRGANSIDPTYIPAGQKDKNDPLGQRGYIGARFYHAASVLNNGWAALAWVGTPSL